MALQVIIWMSGTDNEITYLNQTWLDYAGRPSDAGGPEHHETVFRQTNWSDAARCTTRPSSGVNLFSWSTGSGVTTANIAGW